MLCTIKEKMGTALGQLFRSMAHLCEDAEWHSKCCTQDSGCTCDAETHAGGEVERDVAAGIGCCWLEAHEGPNDPEVVKDFDA